MTKYRIVCNKELYPWTLCKLDRFDFYSDNENEAKRIATVISSYNNYTGSTSPVLLYKIIQGKNNKLPHRISVNYL